MLDQKNTERLFKVRDEAVAEHKLTPSDIRLLESYYSIADGISNLLGSGCEVVLHSLEKLNQSVYYIVNGHITGRKAGSPITDFALKKLHELIDSENGCTEGYYSRLADGTVLRSVTILIKNSEGIPVGLLCINLSLSTPVHEFMRTILPGEDLEEADVTENYPASMDELVDQLVHSTVKEINSEIGLSNKMKNRCIVRKLAKIGVFDMKEAVQIVADKLCISKHTVYYYLRELKENDSSPGDC